jgi:acetyl-CoA/propionyl-CoA carboxylase biotin carboxyl carrier protein
VRDELTPREVAEELGVTIRTVQRWIASGRLPGTRVGGRMRVARASLSTVGSEAAVPVHPIRAVLIANRGEIAIRIARTAHRLGMRVIRVHEPDEPAPIGPDLALQIPSYLDGEAILDAARRAGADAIHPGYGFLAENAGFAAAVMASGLVWVGPPPEAIEAMGDKAAARRLASAHGVPVVPGYDDPAQDDESLAAAAINVGLPLLIKPAAGGGGKGMRQVRSADTLPDELAASRREAKAAFGDDRLILERLIENARHVEVQVLFDADGRGAHLGERDCSTQRRQQKVVEEAPAPSVDRALRQSLGEAALAVASAAGYVGAGTVEFLVTDEGEFFFLEMNTRLQVEHPVTEAVTGRDLVADQLRIAAGEPLGIDQASVRWRGHAIEARLFAEDPEAGFLPATGRVVVLRLPDGDGIRVDAGIVQGDLVSDRYDPLLAKIIVHGSSRRAALDRMRAALEDTHLLGVRTNLAFLRWLVRQPSFADGEMRTDTLAQLALPGPIAPPEDAWAAAAAVLADELGGERPWSGGWRLNARPTIRISHGSEERSVQPRMSDRIVTSRAETAFVDVDGQSLEFRLATPPSLDDAVRHASQAEGAAMLTAPMPGRVVAVRRMAGDAVAAHDPVVVIEAMKMEHAVSAPIPGTVAAIHVQPGDQVQRGDLLAEVSAT